MTTRRDALRTAALLPLAATALAARAAPAVSGVPLAGHFTHDSVRIWLQATEDAAATLRHWPAGGREEEGAQERVRLTRAGGFCAILDIGALRPATTYRYRVTLEGGGSAMGTFRTAPAPDAAPADFRVYLGSCAYTEVYTRGGNPYGANHHIFATMAARMAEDTLPHFMVWLGDNLYLRGPSATFGAVAEYSSAAHMELRYRDVRSQLQLRRLFAATHHYAIWDDHDYGANNDDRTFALKEDSLRLFRAYWPNPPMGSAELPGTWCRFRHQDAEFFLLDNRFHRDGPKVPAAPEKAAFGKAQMAWLKRCLLESTAPFKLVCAGTQFLGAGSGGEGWQAFPGERDEFFAWLARNPVSGLVLLSGDRHNTQVLREGAIREFTCSPLTSKIIPLTKSEWDNPRLDRDTVIETQNFGTLEFSGRGEQRRITARAHDCDGKLLWTRVLAGAG